MKKAKTAPAPAAPVPVAKAPALPHAKGTNRSVTQLAQATHRLSMRRLRDLLPGKIASKRLVLRAPIRGDVPDLVKLADNSKIHDVLSRLPSPYTRADAIGFVEIFAQRADERPYAITLDDRFIGVVGFTFTEGGPPELGYWLGEPFWGHGYMSEAVRALLDAAFATGHFQHLKARALATNAGSLKVLGKSGFKPVGKGIETHGTLVGQKVVYLELERPRWM